MSCAVSTDLYRKVVIIDYKTKEMIPNAKVSFITKDTLLSIQVEAIPDTLNIRLKNAIYHIETMATGYKKVQGSIVLTKTDKLLMINLTPIELDSVTVSWEGAIITIKDSSGRFKSVRHK